MSARPQALAPVLYEHEDGSYLVAYPDSATIASEPRWHRLGPVEIEQGDGGRPGSTSTPQSPFRLVWEQGTPIVWAADRAAWRDGIAREAVSRADRLVGMVRQQHRGGYEPADAAELLLLGQIERLLTAAILLTDRDQTTVEELEERLADNVLGSDWCVGTLSVTGVVVAKGIEGDPELTR